MAPDDAEALADPLDHASGGTDIASPDDPADMVVEAEQAGLAAPEQVPTDVPEDEKALVKDWWSRTSATADFKDACSRMEKDLLCIMGGTQTEIDDAAKVTVNHVYRNTMQTVALTVPENHGVRWSPREEVQPLTGEPMPPEMVERKKKQLGLAAVVSTLMRTFGEECNLQEKLEAWVQDGSHFRASILKVWFQADLLTDALSDERLPDAQDNYANLRVLVERFARGEFNRDDADFYRMRDLMAGLGKDELTVKCGIMVEEVPLNQYRVDPSVTAPEHHYTARWERQDVLKTRSEVAACFEKVKLEDLDKCSVWSTDEAGKLIKSAMDDRTATADSGAAVTALPSGNAKRKDDDWLLCAEIYDYVTNQRITLVEGLEYVADKQPLDKQAFGGSPYVVLVMNRVPGRWYGISDTELQDKIQTAINRLRTDEEESRDAALPRWAFDPAAIEGKALASIKNAGPLEYVPVPVAGKGTLKDSLMELAGNHAHNGQDFANSRMAMMTELRAMAMLPEQALGVTGGAEFAAEVNVAAAGATIMAKYRQARIARALKRFYDKSAQLILWNVGMDMAVRYAGPMAAKYWLQTAPERAEVFETLRLSIDINMDRQLDYNKRVESISKLLEVLVKLGMPFDKEALGKLLVKYLDLGEDGEALIQSDPNDLVMRLVASVQENPQGLTPESMMALAQLGAVAQQQVKVMAAEQAAAEAAGGEGGEQAGGAMPPVPGGVPAPAQAEAPMPAMAV